MKFDVEYFERASTFTQNQRRNLLSFYLKLPVHIQLEIYNKHLSLTREKHQSCVKDKFAEFSFANFFLAISEINKNDITKKPRSGLTEKERQRVHEIKLSKISNKKNNPSQLRDIIEKEFFSLISELRETDLSWRQISHYISKYHRRRISPTYLLKIYSGLIK